MKKVFAILAVVSMMSFVACNNAPKTEVVEEEIVLAEEVDGDEDVTEEDVEEPAK